MKFKKSYLFILLIFISFIFNNCNNKQHTEQNTTEDTTLNLNPENPTIIKLNDKIFSVPSPIQISILIKNLNIDFSEQNINPAENSFKYLTSYEQALNMGIYSTNLGYLHIYEHYSTAAEYFSAIRRLGSDLGVMNSFNDKILKRIENNSQNKDSLVYIFSTIYRDIDSYLLKNDRKKISILIITGGWIESLYLLTQTYQYLHTQAIINRIGEQKNPLNNVIELLQPFYHQNNDELDKLYEELYELKKIYSEIKQEYIYEEFTVIPEKKLTIIISQTKITISEAQIKEITYRITKIRSDIVQ